MHLTVLEALSAGAIEIIRVLKVSRRACNGICSMSCTVGVLANTYMVLGCGMYHVCPQVTLILCMEC